MTDKEAMKLALDALEEIYDAFKVKRDMAFYKEDYDEAIIALKERLADPMREVQRLGQEIEQEPVALPCCGYTDASAVKWNPLNGVVQCHNCGQTYIPPAPQRTEQEPVAHWSDCAVHSEPAYPKSECDCGGIVAVADYTALSDKYVALSDKYVALKAQHKEQEPVAWLLTDKNINSLQVDSIQRLINRLNHAHHTDLCVRINGQDEWFQADWLKHMVIATPPQRKPLTDDEMKLLWAKHGYKSAMCKPFARAIEAAHGIKENT